MPDLEVAVTKCFFCHEDSTIVMNTITTTGVADAVKKMDGKVVDCEPCTACAGYMKQGIILVSIRNDEPRPAEGEMPNPYRTGGWCVMTEDAFTRIFHAILKAESRDVISVALKARFLFVEDRIWDAIKLPRGEVKDDAQGV